MCGQLREMAEGKRVEKKKREYDFGQCLADGVFLGGGGGIPRERITSDLVGFPK